MTKKPKKEKDPERVRIGKMVRLKGGAFERKVAKLFAAAMPGAKVKRGLQSRGAATDEVPDVLCPIYWPECKHGKQHSPRAALRQAVSDSKGTGKVPIAVVQDNRQEPFVCLSLDDFMEMVRELWELSNE